MGLLLAIETIKICFVFHTGFYTISLISEKYAVYCKVLVNKFVLLATCMFLGRHYQFK